MVQAAVTKLEFRKAEALFARAAAAGCARSTAAIPTRSKRAPNARTNDADVSSVATWVLGGIDPEAAKPAGVK